MNNQLPASAQRACGRRARLVASSALAGLLALSLAGVAQALPTQGAVVAGSATIAAAPGALVITQTSRGAVINWQGFSIARGESVQFVQPNARSVVLNRVLGSDPSVILGQLSANGQVFLVNPNGVLFGASSQISVGGLVASTLQIDDADFMAGRYRFAGAGTGSVVNQGVIDADGGSVVLLGGSVSNQGVISARLGAVSLAAGDVVTLDVAGDGLLNVQVDAGAVSALVENGGMIRADGGRVLLTARSANALLGSAVNNTGVIQAQTLENRQGVIRLMGDADSGVVNVAGRLDASAPNGGNGGSIETSAARVDVASNAQITTAAPQGVTGTWLIDPLDFTIGAGGNISGATLSALLVTNSVTISTTAGPDATVPGSPPTTSLHTTTVGNGDINVNDAVSWTATPNTTTLTLAAFRDVNINAAITATNGNLVVCCGRDVNVRAAVTTTNGSVLLSGGRDANLSALGAMTTTDGNITICVGEDINVDAAITLTRGSTIPSQSLGLTPGLMLIAGNSGRGPGVAGGTLTYGALAPPTTVTGPNANVVIDYNPVSYAAPTDYSTHFVLSQGAILTQHMLVYPGASKTFDGGTGVTLVGLKGAPAGVNLVAGPGATAVFDSATVGSDVGVTFSGYSLSGPTAARYALPTSCCVTGSRTTGTILAAASPPPSPPPVSPPPSPPPVSPPPVSPPPVSPPPVSPPPVSPPPVSPPPVSPPPVSPPPVSPPPVVSTSPPLAGGFGPSASGPAFDLALAVLGGGMTMPAAPTQPEAPAQAATQAAQPAPAAAPAAHTPAPVPFVAPVYPRKQDRN
ncbi:filamentous hemagglutinin family protein [Caulobacter ginsengisoli]|uniref:Filamentous hemagglutinin family protein n=1 Tax=Caulobacter ginsengisoli TaxID=400775 RepID=A0ABU0IQZ4_9CAUL|nr:filamentous hemagglutinin N-terminal domain-containing protein [Caulobacter ginsengisoli]MDQ0464389.1 filamentous hemagglutinin family protein [Caulobacter ginsengisoli]